MKNKTLDVVFILDKSGSMSGSEENTITSFNEYLEREKNNKFKTRITTLLFSDNYKYLYKSKDITKVDKLTNKEYYVEGCTALYDALGNAINYIDNQKTDKVMFIIITDGYENASKEFDKNKIKALIDNHSNYEFIYIGADIDSFQTGNNIGIKNDNIANYKKDRKGISLLFKSIGNLGSKFMEEESISADWKEDLDNYIEKNKE